MVTGALVREIMDGARIRNVQNVIHQIYGTATQTRIAQMLEENGAKTSIQAPDGVQKTALFTQRVIALQKVRIGARQQEQVQGGARAIHAQPTPALLMSLGTAIPKQNARKQNQTGAERGARRTRARHVHQARRGIAEQKTNVKLPEQNGVLINGDTHGARAIHAQPTPALLMSLGTV